MRQFTRLSAGILVAMILPSSQSIGSMMYWADITNHSIQRANLDGSGIEDLVTSGIDQPRGLTLDVVGGKMYWAEAGGSGVPVGIRRANLDGTYIEDLVTTGLSGPFGIAVDAVGGKMYWTDNGTRKIQRANLDGTGVEDIVTPATADIIWPWGLDLDLAGGKVYWVDGSILKLQRANLDGTSGEELYTTRLTGPLREVAIDALRDMIYIANADSILRANLDGTGLTTILTLDFGNPTGLAIDLLDEKLYWTQPSQHGSVARIQRANLDGTGIETLVTVDNGGFSPIALHAFAPEPSTLSLLALGGLGAVMRRRRRTWGGWI